MGVIEEISLLGVVPVVVIDCVSDVDPLADALLAGGIDVIEITLRTEAGLGAIEQLRSKASVTVGAGTVLNAALAERALGAGASFLVSPGLDEGVVAAGHSQGVPVLPGIATATELQRAWNMGLRAVKFFPAENIGGAKMLKAMSSVFADMRFMPTGGITADNLAAYLSLPSVIACGGSWMVAASLIEAGDFAAITDKTKAALKRVNEIRKEQS